MSLHFMTSLTAKAPWKMVGLEDDPASYWSLQVTFQVLLLLNFGRVMLWVGGFFMLLSESKKPATQHHQLTISWLRTQLFWSWIEPLKTNDWTQNHQKKTPKIHHESLKRFQTFPWNMAVKFQGGVHLWKTNGSTQNHQKKSPVSLESPANSKLQTSHDFV